jgi:hypothetical protein
MNPDVAQAVLDLESAGILRPEQAAVPLRVARGELLSVRAELRALLYAGVLLIAGGVGVLVEQHLDRIGPLAIALALGLAAAAALGWVVHVAPLFSWQEVASPNLAFDYLLLLGVLLAAADLAYVEVKFTPLGAHWPWHLLIVAVAAGVAAFRFDSRVVFSLALSSFAAWRGVSLASAGSALWSRSPAAAWRTSAIFCGVLFILLGLGLVRSRRKAHFEPVAVHLGWLLTLGGLVSGMVADRGRAIAWAVLLLVTGAGLAVGAYRARRFPLCAYGLFASYLALIRPALGPWELSDVQRSSWLLIGSAAMVAGLLAAHRGTREAH